MRTQFSKLAQVAAFVLAMAFIFSCSMDTLTNTLKELDKLSSSEKNGSSSYGKESDGGSTAGGVPVSNTIARTMFTTLTIGTWTTTTGMTAIDFTIRKLGLVFVA